MSNTKEMRQAITEDLCEVAMSAAALLGTPGERHVGAVVLGYALMEAVDALVQNREHDLREGLAEIQSRLGDIAAAIGTAGQS
jgi:hypothetical protein